VISLIVAGLRLVSCTQSKANKIGPGLYLYNKDISVNFGQSSEYRRTRVFEKFQEFFRLLTISTVC
jgi:hypothetical protein